MSVRNGNAGSHIDFRFTLGKRSVDQDAVDDFNSGVSRIFSSSSQNQAVFSQSSEGHRNRLFGLSFFAVKIHQLLVQVDCSFELLSRIKDDLAALSDGKRFKSFSAIWSNDPIARAGVVGPSGQASSIITTLISSGTSSALNLIASVLNSSKVLGLGEEVLFEAIEGEALDAADKIDGRHLLRSVQVGTGVEKASKVHGISMEGQGSGFASDFLETADVIRLARFAIFSRFRTVFHAQSSDLIESGGGQLVPATGVDFAVEFNPCNGRSGSSPRQPWSALGQF